MTLAGIIAGRVGRIDRRIGTGAENLVGGPRLRGYSFFPGEKKFKKVGEIASGFLVWFDYQFVRLVGSRERATLDDAAGNSKTFKLAKVAKMARLTREQLFTPDEMAIVHVMNRAVRRCFLMGYDQFTGRNYDYRKD